MAYVQKSNPFKSRKDLRAAKKEEKNFRQTSLSDSELMGSMSGPSVREARKERRQLKKSIRKGTYKPTETTSTFGVMKSTPGMDLSESKRKIRIAKVGKRERKERTKEQKNKPKFDISKIKK
tara:strand:- start:117 stop:482 length:366 start_codon:yes stop_codon:yes gene_type:complete